MIPQIPELAPGGLFAKMNFSAGAYLRERLIEKFSRSRVFSTELQKEKDNLFVWCNHNAAAC